MTQNQERALSNVSHFQNKADDAMQLWTETGDDKYVTQAKYFTEQALYWQAFC